MFHCRGFIVKLYLRSGFLKVHMKLQKIGFNTFVWETGTHCTGTKKVGSEIPPHVKAETISLTIETLSLTI